jgi:hypothetical protein
VENAVSNPTKKVTKIIKIKMSTAKTDDGQFKSICKVIHKIQPKDKENYNDLMRIYIVSTVGIHKPKDNIPPESRTFVAYKMKKL